MEHVLIFANPIAGRGRGAAVARLLEGRLRHDGYEVSVFLSRAASAGWSGGGISAAIVIGGDGTLRSVAQWAIDRALRTQPHQQSSDFSAAAAAAPIGYPLLLVPMGTANLMGRHLGIMWDPPRLGDEVSEALRRRRLVHLDVGRTPDGVFLLMAGVGFDAWIVHELERLRTGPIHHLSYAMPALRALASYRFPSLSVVVDGRKVFNTAPALAMVGNVPEYGTGFPILPHARADDQMLDVCVMPCSSRAGLARLFLAALAGEHIHEEGVVYVKGRQIRIESPQVVPVQLDGEAAGTTPIDIDLLPGRIPFIVPA